MTAHGLRLPSHRGGRISASSALREGKHSRPARLRLRPQCRRRVPSHGRGGMPPGIGLRTMKNLIAGLLLATGGLWGRGRLLARSTSPTAARMGRRRTSSRGWNCSTTSSGAPLNGTVRTQGKPTAWPVPALRRYSVHRIGPLPRPIRHGLVRSRFATNQRMDSRCNTALRLVLPRNIAVTQACHPRLEPSITEPVLMLNFLPQTFARQRNGMVLCLLPVWTFSDPGSTRPAASAARRTTSSVRNLSGNS